MDEAKADVKASLLSSGIRADLPVGGALELEHHDQLGGSLVGGFGRHPVQATLEHELRAAGDLAVGAAGLADVADPFANPGLLGRELAPGHPGGAAAGWQQRRQHPQRGRLARAVRPEKAEDLAAAHVQVHARDGFHLPVARLEHAAQTPRFNYRFRAWLDHPTKFCRTRVFRRR